MVNYSIGVDLGGTNLRVAAVSEKGKVIKRLTLETEVTRGRDAVVAAMVDGIRSLTTEHKNDSLAGIGIGVPGIIDVENGMLHQSPNLPGWDNYPVRDDIERRLGTKVILENDANVAALGEKWVGAGRDTDNLCMITLGTGVGGGIVLNGRLWHGAHGFAGEVGHITVVPDGHPCGCGGQGCVEQYASATAVRRLAKEAMDAGKAPALKKRVADGAELTSEFVYKMAMDGDPGAQEVFRIVGRALGLAISEIINTLDLPMIVIGGGAASAWDAFYPSLLKELRRRSYVYRTTTPESGSPDSAGKDLAGKPTVISHAMLGGDAGLIGAARLPLLAS